MRRSASTKFAAAFAGLLLLGSANVALAPAAAAAGTCDFTNTLCLWDQPQFSGSQFNVRSMVDGGTCVDLVAHGWGGRARSGINTNSKTASLFASDDCTGRPYPVDPGSRSADLTFSANSVFVY